MSVQELLLHYKIWITADEVPAHFGGYRYDEWVKLVKRRPRAASLIANGLLGVPSVHGGQGAAFAKAWSFQFPDQGQLAIVDRDHHGVYYTASGESMAMKKAIDFLLQEVTQRFDPGPREVPPQVEA
ncbi:MAG: hypothetical protein M1602_01140 [Firmicutes bacterium]|nr:hypothetical protein [Bacillota bacterium]